MKISISFPFNFFLTPREKIQRFPIAIFFLSGIDKFESSLSLLKTEMEQHQAIDRIQSFKSIFGAKCGGSSNFGSNYTIDVSTAGRVAGGSLTPSSTHCCTFAKTKSNHAIDRKSVV